MLGGKIKQSSFLGVTIWAETKIIERSKLRGGLRIEYFRFSLQCFSQRQDEMLSNTANNC